jgi:hypothetical protein
MKLSHVALVPTCFINIVVLLRATANDIHFDLGRNVLYCLVTGKTVYYVKRLRGYWVLIYRKPTNSLKSLNQSTFLIRRF